MRFRHIRALLVGIFHLFASVACGQSETDDALEMIEHDMQTQVRDVEVIGTVVSQSGETVDDVKIEYYTRKYGDVLLDVPKDYKIIESDGTFKIRENNVTSVVIRFSKSGFYKKSWSYVVSDVQETFEIGEVKRFELGIALIEVPESAPLRRYSGVLQFGSDGHRKDMFISQSGSSVAVERGIGSKGSSQPVVSNSIYLDASRDVSGNFAVKKQTPSERTSTGVVLDRGWIKLGHAGNGEGFKIFEPKQVPTRPELAFREMELAPAEGYVPEIGISATASPDYVYFYLKLDGRYGKGFVNAKPIIENEGGNQLAKARIVLFMNPTGSREVAYLHD